MEVPHKIKNRSTARSIYTTPRHIAKGNESEERFALTCSLQHYAQQSRCGNNLSVHGQVNGYRKCGEYTRWNFSQS